MKRFTVLSISVMIDLQSAVHEKMAGLLDFNYRGALPNFLSSFWGGFLGNQETIVATPLVYLSKDVQVIRLNGKFGVRYRC